MGVVSDIEHPSASASPVARRGKLPPAKADVAKHADLYRIAYQEGQRTLDDQQSELTGTRDRAVQFTAFVGAATAFLVGTGLHPAHRDATFYTLASVASALSVALILLLIVVLSPSRKKLWYYRMSTTSLISGYIETEVPPPSEAHVLRALAARYNDMREKNEALLAVIRRAYRWLIVLGSLQVTVWAALVWVKA